MAFNITGRISISDVRDGRDGQPGTPGSPGGTGPRGAGRWNVRVGTALAATYTQTQLNTFLANTIPGTTTDAPVAGDQLWLFASASTTDITPTDQRVYLYTTTWNEQEEVIDGDLLVTGTMNADRITTDTLVLGQVTDAGTTGAAGMAFTNDLIEIRDAGGNVRIRIGNLGST